jgi:hypothetical protein
MNTATLKCVKFESYIAIFSEAAHYANIDVNFDINNV